MTGARRRPELGMRELSRRDLLKRGAALGTAGMWLTPAVQVIAVGRASAQLASQPTPPAFVTSTTSTTSTSVPAAGRATTGPSTTTSTIVPVSVAPPSQVDLVVTNSTGTRFGARFVDRANPAWSAIPTASPGCAGGYTGGYTTDQAVVSAMNANAQVVLSPGVDGRATYTIKLPAGFTIVAGWGMCGQRCVPAIAVGNNSYDFHC